jgi:hypothetical protein
MLYEVKVRVTEKPWLGEQRTKEHVRKFRRDKKDRIAIDHTQWQWAFTSAAKALHYDIDASTIRTESGFSRPTLSLYNRKYSYKGAAREEMFESIREGTIVSFNILVMEAPPEDTEGQQQRPPTEKELRTILDYVGMFIGLSPWGSRWGYGTFEVDDIKQV